MSHALLTNSSLDAHDGSPRNKLTKKNQFIKKFSLTFVQVISPNTEAKISPSKHAR